MNRYSAMALSLTLLWASGAHANLLANGSFELGTFVNQGNDTMSLPVGSTVITGWTVTTDTTAWIGASNPFAGLAAKDGSFFLDLTNYQAGPPFAGMSQTIATAPGATYSLSFDLGAGNVWGRPDSITAAAAGTSMTFVTPTTGTANDWYLETMQFVAASSSTTIELQGASGVNYIGLDNASVEFVSGPSTPAVPEPQNWALLAAGLVALVAFSRARSGSS